MTETGDARVKAPYITEAGVCGCTWHSEDRGGGYTEVVPEYEPSCPVHSEHLYDPRSGAWVLGPTDLLDQIARALAVHVQNPSGECAEDAYPWPCRTVVILTRTDQ